MEVPVSRGKGSRRRPFSPFLEFYLSGVGYLRLRWGIRGRGYNTGKGKIRQDTERSSSVTAAKFRPQSLKESLVSQQPTAVQPSPVYSLVPAPATLWQPRELRLRHAGGEGPSAPRDGQSKWEKEKTNEETCNSVDPTGQGREGGTDKVILSFYDEKTAREICAARMRGLIHVELAQCSAEYRLVGRAFPSFRYVMCHGCLRSYDMHHITIKP